MRNGEEIDPFLLHPYGVRAIAAAPRQDGPDFGGGSGVSGVGARVGVRASRSTGFTRRRAIGFAQRDPLLELLGGDS